MGHNVRRRGRPAKWQALSQASAAGCARGRSTWTTYSDAYRACQTPQEDWLVVTGDYHS